MNMKKKKQVKQSNCQCCSHYVYNDDYEYYECLINLDEDEMIQFLKGTFQSCPYFRYYYEYKIVRKQM